MYDEDSAQVFGIAGSSSMYNLYTYPKTKINRNFRQTKLSVMRRFTEIQHATHRNEKNMQKKTLKKQLWHIQYFVKQVVF